MSRRNNVRGPASALTDFLQASGITTAVIRRRAATRRDPPEGGPSNVAQDEGDNGNGDGNEDEDHEMAEEGNEVTAPPVPRRRRATRAATASGYISDELDEPPSAAPSPTKKPKLSKAAEARKKAQAKKKARKGVDVDDEDGSDEDDMFTALSKSRFSNSPAKPPVGSFENCAKCGKQFTVTKYTIAANPGPGFLCHPCAKSSGADPFKKPAVPKKRRAPADKRTVTNFEERRFPSLSSLCIQLISEHIDDVEALGDLSSISMDEISKSISKNRSLTGQTAQLFYGAHNTTLTLYDATKLIPSALDTLAQLNPNLTSLRLDFCGRMNDAVMDAWSASLPALTHVELLGPFLVRPPGWLKFFSSHPKLEAFLITQSPRFDLACLKSLLANCKALSALRLKEVGLLNDQFLTALGTIKEGHLTSLDLSEPSQSCTEAAMIKAMKAIGGNLTKLDLSGHSLLGDAFLEKGLKPLRHLEDLALNNLPELTDAGVAKLFDGWENAALTGIDLSRNYGLGSNALTGILEHSGDALQRLNLNGWGDFDVDAIHAFGKELVALDLGWCRSVDDFLIKDILGCCGKLREVKVWGCNRVTERCPRKRGVVIHGVESHSTAT
ncbi:RNI-like protein [Pleurotus eryngii]|uniref:RNI-like protein n=1 Tax=Pleurotus eryngii TaxID=5323 RepID=A0A9P5ZME4_PLEER|nr:RNI-like protein [Pleurotus eryngii]